MIRTLFVIFIISILIVTWYVYMQRKRDNHTHILSKMMPHNKCPLTIHKDSLVSCHDDDNKCGACEEDKPRVCTVVNADNPYSYKLKSNDNPLNVPTGKWCLPPKSTDLTCNPMTGDPVLTKRGSDYIWRCQCKYPKLIDNAGVYGDCSEIAACGAKLAGSTNTLVCPDGSTTCTPGQPWSEDPTWDPMAAVCRCGPYQKYIERGETKLCVDDECFPGETDPNNPGQCLCPDGKTDADGNNVSYVSHNGQCIDDPCNPGGTFDGRTCVCNKPQTVAKLDILSPLKWTCSSPCDWRNNPCGTKGTCKINKDGRAICTDCVFPNYQSKDNRCNNIVKPQYARCKSGLECESRICGKQCKLQRWGWVDHPVCCPTKFNS
jgi:hypothetical protein